jgi:glycosyltransferase involved in cell wall biosynthesis
MSEKNKKSICLTMIVKNESKTIQRCIESVERFIDYWVIVDTGSSDGTQEIIQNLMKAKGIPGELHEREWVDYSTNRNQSLELAKGKADYRLIIDADDVLAYKDENVFNDLEKDSYKFMIRLGNLAYYRTQLINGSQDWKYKGVIHEYLTGPEGGTEDFLPGAEMHASVSGDTREIKGKDKYYNDALIIEKTLLTTPDLDQDEDLKRRYVFYLAQSYRDGGVYDRALENYERRVSMGGWDEEVYISLYWIANIKKILGKSKEEIIDSYMRAWEFRPVRLEALYNLIRFLIEEKRFNYAFALSTVAMRSPTCNDVLFVEEEIWRWRMPDEYSVLCYYTGNFAEAYNSAKRLSESKFYGIIPDNEKERIQKNIKAFHEAAFPEEYQNSNQEKEEVPVPETEE